GGGDGRAGKGGDGQHRVGPAVVVDGGKRAERNAERGGKDQRGEGQFQGRRQPLLDVDRHRSARVGACAEVEARHLRQVDAKLHQQRLIEAILVADLGDLGGGGVLAGECRGRIGGAPPRQKKREKHKDRE